MIPLRLSITGFLSYREPVEIDFSSFDLACIVGPNGAGKSSLLDAITWSLFGVARKRDDSLIHQRSALANVSLVFAYEGNIYRTRRIKPREKTMALEFHILQEGDSTGTENERIMRGIWKPLTERTLRETEALIEKTLRMDYETFINASFFLQGKADQFTQQRPGDRKRILGSILGLEVWESYRNNAYDRRRAVEGEISRVDGSLKEIYEELAQEKNRRERLSALEENLQRQEELCQRQEREVQRARQEVSRLADQKRLVDFVARQLEASERRLKEMHQRLEERRQEQLTFTDLVGRAEQIEADHAAWLEKRTALADFAKVAEKFQEFEKQRQEPLLVINGEKIRLEGERKILLEEQAQVADALETVADLNRQVEAVHKSLNFADERLQLRLMLEGERQEKRQQQADQRAENSRLKPEMDRLKERIERLKASETPECPLCGQTLLPADRIALIERLEAEGKEMGDCYRENQARWGQINQELGDLEIKIEALKPVEAEIRQLAGRRAQLDEQIKTLQARVDAWNTTGSQRLREVQTTLEQGSYAVEAQARLTELDLKLKELGYDAAAHEAIRQAEETGRTTEEELRKLEGARSALAPINREITELEEQLVSLEADYLHQQEEYRQAAEAFASAQAQAPDLREAEQLLLVQKELENRLRLDVGAAKQNVLVLEVLKNRKREYEAEREVLAHQVQLYKQLERAFGKDGVPALLIEQVLPVIESKANDTLDRLSAGGMSVEFVTQTKYKDRNRDDLRETLDIRISDGAGTRDYEMFSGGEAFRVNFAIRLALAEMLAQRAGARLQTLVVDEGFGSQDALGRQHLIEAINLVRQDFKKILIITHIEELKEYFPTRIEVEKSDMGSTVQVV